MHSLIKQLLARGPVITDGAWGTQLQARGLGLGEFPDLWNLLHPDRVLEVARAYVDAGSQVILTNTFGANRVRLAEHGNGAQKGRSHSSHCDSPRISRTNMSAVTKPSSLTHGPLAFLRINVTGA